MTRSKQRMHCILLIGLWINRNWILGNWIKEITTRHPEETQIHWIASVFSGKKWWERLVRFPIPEYGAYFFSYPSIFETYIKTNEAKYKNKSIVNYTHNMDELGSLRHQAQVLNKAYSVHFNCSRDSEKLILNGLNERKVRIVYGAVDDDCKLVPGIEREPKSILLASKFGPRKGLEILPDLISELTDWKFLILGRGWQKFLKNSGLSEKPNLEYHHFDKKSRNVLMSRASVFLSLSNLEGGPIPLLESIQMGLIPIATDTGFARDFIKNQHNGFLLSNPPTTREVRNAIISLAKIKSISNDSVKQLNWDRLAEIVMSDARMIMAKVKGELP